MRARASANGIAKNWRDERLEHSRGPGRLGEQSDARRPAMAKETFARDVRWLRFS
jgi:hypothetical protein